MRGFINILKANRFSENLPNLFFSIVNLKTTLCLKIVIEIKVLLIVNVCYHFLFSFKLIVLNILFTVIKNLKQ